MLPQRVSVITKLSLCAEEAEKIKVRVVKQGKRKQKHKSKKVAQKKNNATPSPHETRDAGASNPDVPVKQALGDSEDLSEAETTDMVTASGRPVTVSRVNEDLLNIVHSSFRARMEAKRSTQSYIAA